MIKDLLGWYYAQSADGVVQIVQFLDGKCYYLGHEDIIAEPICPVPTYEEYNELKKFKHWEKISCDDEHCCKTVKELRELLKECKNIVAHDCWQEAQFPDGQVVQRQDLLTRINAALNESEE